MQEVCVPDRSRSVVFGPVQPPLSNYTLTEFLDRQCGQYGKKECLLISWTGTRWTYNDLYNKSRIIACELLKRGTKAGDRIGILAGNHGMYAAIFFAVARIGAIAVTLNNMFKPLEVKLALELSGE